MAAKRKSKRPSDQLEHEDFIPDVGPRKRQDKPPPRLEESPPFLFTHHGDAWTVMAGQVIPRLGKLKLACGIGGVGQDPKSGRALPHDAINDARDQQGLVVIPYDVDGPGTTYLKRPIGCPKTHLSRWELCYPGSAQIDCDEAGYVTWTRSLIDRGVIQAPPLYVLDRMEKSLVKQIEDLDDKRGVDYIRKRLITDLHGVRDEIYLRSEPPAATEPVENPLG